MPRLLLIEDDNALRRALVTMLSQRGFEVFDAADGASAIPLATSCQPDFILCDIDLPDTDGYALLAELNGVSMQAQWYFMTGQPVDMLTLQATQGSVAGFIMKPFDVDELLAVFQQETAART